MSLGRLARLFVAGLLFLLGLAVVLLVVVLATNPAPRESAGWTLRAPLPEARGEVTSAVANDRLYVIGGLAGSPPRTVAEVDVYDPATNSWTAAPSLPEARHHTAATADDGQVYVSGGAGSVADWTPRDNLWALDGPAGSWRELARMPEARYGHRLVSLDGRLYVVGGVGGTGAVQVYDQALDSWQLGAPIPAPRDHLAVVVVDGELWAIGGRNGGLTSRVDIYDPATDEWRAGPSLPSATSGAAEAVSDGLILLSGGEDPAPAGAGVFDLHWWFHAGEPAAGWRELPQPPLAVHGTEGVVIAGHFYVPGGATRAGGLSALSWSNALQVYDLSTLDAAGRLSAADLVRPLRPQGFLKRAATSSSDLTIHPPN